MESKCAVVGDKIYNSELEASRTQGVSISSVSDRLNKDWSTDEAFEVISGNFKAREGKEITIFGRTFISISEACRYYNVPWNSIKFRVNSGLSFEEAFQDAIRNYKPRDARKDPITVNGIEYSSMYEACKALGVNRTTINSRLKKGMSMDEAFQTRVKKTSQNITIDGVSYDSIRKACTELGIGYGCIKNRLRLGMSIDEAFHKDDLRISVVVGGVTYESISEATRVLNMNNATVTGRLSKGWSVDEAFELVPREKDGVIDIRTWNIGFSKKSKIKLLEVLKDGAIYKCSDNGNIRFYSKNELVSKWVQLNSSKRI